MSNFRKKAQPFTLGLLLGIVIAGTFFILRLDNYFKELNFYKNFAKTFLDQQSIASQKDKSQRTAPVKITNKKQTVQEPDKGSFPQKGILTKDSLHPDSIINIKPANLSDNIVIRKDELLNIRKIELYNLNPVAIKSHSDSLLEKVSDLKYEGNISTKQSMQIEFWKSPLNYKGYKLSKYNVILYGLTDTQNLKIYMLDDKFYMKHASVVYKLDYNSDFKSYERVLDESILSNFK